MIKPPIWGWMITPEEIKTKILNIICVMLIMTIVLIWGNWYKQQ